MTIRSIITQIYKIVSHMFKGYTLTADTPMTVLFVMENIGIQFLQPSDCYRVDRSPVNCPQLLNI